MAEETPHNLVITIKVGEKVIGTMRFYHSIPTLCDEAETKEFIERTFKWMRENTGGNDERD